MTILHMILLGVLQGLTEFLPVSSSGHLALAQMLIDRVGGHFEQPGVVVDAMLHVGTATAVVWHERHELVRWLSTRPGQRLLMLLVLGTLATAVTAFPARDAAKASFELLWVVGLCLLITSVVVYATRFLGGRDGGAGEETTTWKHAVIVGLAQGLAVFPGISRSGLTIATGLGAGLDRTWAARFSFLMSIPAIAGATLVEVISEREALSGLGLGFWFSACVGALAAAVSGYVALRLVIRMLQSRHFHLFALYCLPLGLVVLVVAWLG
jgi:undecaprenyl-diphosphatase